MRSQIALILLIVSFPTTGFAQEKESHIQAVRIVGTRVSLKPPSGFTPSPEFSGYWLESLASSIIVTEFPGPFAEVSPGFSSPAELMKRGMSLLNKQEVKIGGQGGVLLQAKQNSLGTDYLKWILVFGDEKESVLIAATFPQQFEKELSQKMKASLLTAYWDQGRKVSLTEGLNFTVREIGELKLAKRISNSLAFTKSGLFPSKAIDDPLIIIAQAISKIEVEDLEKFAKSRIFQTASVTDIEIEQSQKVNIDNLSGYEIVAKGKDIESGQPMVIYQTILFQDQSYYIMQGLISHKQSERYLPVFREMVRSFKRTS